MKSNQKSLEITRTIACSAEVLFDAWLDPASIKKWFCPGEDVRVPNPKLDPRVGGKFDFAMTMGTKHLPHNGEYRVIDRPRKLQFTWISEHTLKSETLVTVRFEALDAKKTKITLDHQLLPSDKAVADHTGGWSSILECLEQAFIK